MTTIRPLLSICIPTYNRERSLEAAIGALIPQIIAANGAAELVISDNDSPDGTAEVVARMQVGGLIRYHRNEKNIGAARNISKLCNELATGEFAWVIGDDDLVLQGGVEKVLSILRAFPEVDYVFVNSSTKHPSEREVYERQELFAASQLHPMKAKDLDDHYVESWEELIDPDVDDVFLGALMCSVFRLSRWLSYTLELRGGDKTFSSLENSYPHTVVLANTMIKRKAYYIGHPYTVSFWGAQEWVGYVPLLVLVRLQDLLDLYLRLGVDRERVERCRLYLLRSSSEPLRTMLSSSGTPGREYFSLRYFLWRNRRHLKYVWRMAWGVWGAGKVPKPVYEFLQAVKRRLTSFRAQ